MKTEQKQEATKAAIYVRVSTDEQAQFGYSIEAQKDKLLAFCKSQDWEVYNTYADEGFSAKGLNRPQVQRLIEDAGQRKFNIVVFYKLDRLSRSVKDLNFLIERFENNKVAIKSITEPFDTSSPPGKLMFNMLGSFAQFERELIGERTKLGIGRRVSQGKWTTTPPFGYNMVNGELVINDKEIAYYKRIVELFLFHNYGTTIIADTLNKEDKVTRRAGRWSDSTIWNMLTNPVYCGLVRWGDSVFDGRHKAVITKEEFDMIQKRLRHKNQVPENTHSSPNFLNGLIVCGACNSTLTTAKGKRLYHYYACVGRHKGCKLSYIRTDKLHKALLDQLEEIGKNPAIIQDHIDEHNRTHADVIARLEKELQFARREITELTKKMDKKAAWLSDNLPDKTVAYILGQEIEGISRQIRELKDKVNQIDTEIEQERLGNVNAELIGEFLLHFREMFDKLDMYQKRLLIQSIVKKVTVYGKDQIKLDLALPVEAPQPVAQMDLPELKSAESYPFYQVWGRLRDVEGNSLLIIRWASLPQASIPLPQDNTLGSQLQYLRRCSGESLSSLATRSGHSKSLIANYERNKVKKVDPETLLDLAKALKVSPDKLISLQYFQPISDEAEIDGLFKHLLSAGDFGSKLRDLRFRANIDQKALARQIGLNRESIRRYERNITRPSKEILFRIVEALKTSAKELKKSDSA